MKSIVLEAEDILLRERIGQKLAEALKVHCYGKELTALAARENGIREDLAARLDEATEKSLPLFSLGARYVQKKREAGDPEDYLFACTAKLITQLAGEGSCVILGHAASYTLRNMPEVFRSRLVSGDQAGNKGYERYYSYHTGTDWSTNENVDLVLNVRKLPDEKIVEKLIRLYRIAGKTSGE